MPGWSGCWFYTQIPITEPRSEFKVGAATGDGHLLTGSLLRHVSTGHVQLHVRRPDTRPCCKDVGAHLVDQVDERTASADRRQLPGVTDEDQFA